MARRILATEEEIKARKTKLRELQYVVRCWKCEKWKNFTLRPGGEAKPEDFGLCGEYSIVKEACGYCDKGKEKKNGFQ